MLDSDSNLIAYEIARIQANKKQNVKGAWQRNAIKEKFQRKN